MKTLTCWLRQLLAYGILALTMGTVPAAEWSFEPAVDGRVSYNDNIGLTPATTDRIWGAQVVPRAVFAWREAVTEIAGEGRLGLNRYPGRGELNTTDLFSELRWSTASERNGYGLNARLERDSTLASEARQTGVVQLRRQRTQKGLAPSFRRALSDRASTSLRYQFTDVGYESGSGLRAYRDHQLSAGYSWLWSERLRSDTTLAHDDLRTDDRGVLTTTRSLSQGLSYGLSERINLGISAGWRRSRTTVNSLLCPFGAQVLCDVFGIALIPVSRTTRESGLILAADADVAMDKGRYNFAISRGTHPTGNGLTVRTDRLALQWHGDLTERLTYGTSAALLRSRYDGNLAAASKYLTFDFNLAWKLDERWSFGTQYGFARSRTDGAPGSARSNALFFTVIYQWRPISLK